MPLDFTVSHVLLSVYAAGTAAILSFMITKYQPQIYSVLLSTLPASEWPQEAWFNTLARNGGRYPWGYWSSLLSCGVLMLSIYCPTILKGCTGQFLVHHRGVVPVLHGGTIGISFMVIGAIAILNFGTGYLVDWTLFAGALAIIKSVSMSQEQMDFGYVKNHYIDKNARIALIQSCLSRWTWGLTIISSLFVAIAITGVLLLYFNSPSSIRGYVGDMYLPLLAWGMVGVLAGIYLPIIQIANRTSEELKKIKTKEI